MALRVISGGGASRPQVFGNLVVMNNHPLRVEIQNKLSALSHVADRFLHAGVEFTLGGSCLLFAHGLVDNFDDIDLLTEDREDKVLTALRGIDLYRMRSTGIFSSDFFYKFEFAGCKFDLMGNFHIQKLENEGHGPITKIHSIEVGRWNGIPLGSLKVWKRAYELMERPEKAAIIP